MWLQCLHYIHMQWCCHVAVCIWLQIMGCRQHLLLTLTGLLICIVLMFRWRARQQQLGQTRRPLAQVCPFGVLYTTQKQTLICMFQLVSSDLCISGLSLL